MLRKLLKRFNKVLNDEILMTEGQILSLIDKLRRSVVSEREEVIVEEKIAQFYNRYNF